MGSNDCVKADRESADRTLSERGVVDLLAEITAPAASSPALVAEARKTILNTLACAVGAARSEPMASVTRASVPGPSLVCGTQANVTMQRAALLNGMLAHFEDFDDTHGTYRCHGGAPVVSAALAVASACPSHVPGERFLAAVIAGMEFHYRIAGRMMPAHHLRGWHPSGTFGVLGAAVSAAVASGASLAQLTSAVAIASGMTVGVREVFGTEAKPFNIGQAAANGVRAARLAMAGRASATTGLAGPDGYCASLAGDVSLTDLTSWRPANWELLRNTYKPYPCGKVIHPIIDAGIEMRRVLGGVEADSATWPERVSQVERVEVRCHPAVLDVTGITRPRTSFEARFSCYYGFATGLLRGSAHQHDFELDSVLDPQIHALLERITITKNPAFGSRDAATATAWLADGSSPTVEITAALGSLGRPMSYEDIHAKTIGLTESIDPTLAGRLREAVDRLERAASTEALVASCQPVEPRAAAVHAHSEPAGKDSADGVDAPRAVQSGGGADASLTDAVVTFARTAIPPPSAMEWVGGWYAICADVIAGCADCGDAARLDRARRTAPDEAAGAEGSTSQAAFHAGLALGAAAPAGIFRAFLPIAAAVFVSRSSDARDAVAEALAVGTEVAVRFQRAIDGTDRDIDSKYASETAGWDTAGSLGPVASAVALIRLHGLDASDAHALLTLTGVQIGGLGRQARAGLEDLNVGVAAAAAVDAHVLIGTGLTPSADILGGRRGMLHALGVVGGSALTGEWLLAASREH